MTSHPRPDTVGVVRTLINHTNTDRDDPQVTDEEFFIVAGHGKTITWDIHRHRTVMTHQRDHQAAQVRQASRNGLGHARSHKLRSWYMLPAEQDEGGANILAYLDLLDAELAALADMSHGDMVTDAEEQTADPHSGAPPGGAREVRPHTTATLVSCTSSSRKEAGHVARLLPAIS